MSHFTVLVVGDNVEEQLAPYNEDITVDPYWQESDWVERSIQKLVEDEEVPEFVSGLSGEEYAKLYSEYWKDGEKYKYEDGKYFYETTYNPDSQWDWYQIGGRWRGFFRVVPGADHLLGSGSMLLDYSDEDFTNRADVVRRKDLDFEAQVADAREKAATTWDENNDITNPEYEKSYYRAVYTDEWLAEYFCLDAENPRAAYIDKMARGAFSTYAVVKDGQWAAKGKVGWFGMSDDKVDQEAWDKHIFDLIENLPGDTVLTLVDAHI